MLAITERFINDPDSLTNDSVGPSSSGCNASVFPGLEEGTVVKIGHRLQDAWLLWASHCMTTRYQMPWMPKIYGLVIQRDAETFQALCEEYEHVEGTPWIQCEFRELMRSNCRRERRYRKALRKYAPGLIPHLQLAHFSTHKHALSQLVRVDLHCDNWMVKRCGQLIVNDPSHITTGGGFNDEDVLEIVAARAVKSKGRIIVR